MMNATQKTIRKNTRYTRDHTINESAILDYIDARMKELGLNYNQLQEMTGVHRTTLPNARKNHHIPTYENLKKICDALNISMDDLADISEGRQPEKHLTPIARYTADTVTNWPYLMQIILKKIVEIFDEHVERKKTRRQSGTDPLSPQNR